MGTTTPSARTDRKNSPQKTERLIESVIIVFCPAPACMDIAILTAGVLFSKGGIHGTATFPKDCMAAIWGGVRDPKTFLAHAWLIDAGHLGEVAALYRGVDGTGQTVWRGHFIEGNASRSDEIEVALADDPLVPVIGLLRALFSQCETVHTECGALHRTMQELASDKRLGAAEAPNERSGGTAGHEPVACNGATGQERPRSHENAHVHSVFQQIINGVRQERAQ